MDTFTPVHIPPLQTPGIIIQNHWLSKIKQEIIFFIIESESGSVISIFDKILFII